MNILEKLRNIDQRLKNGPDEMSSKASDKTLSFLGLSILWGGIVTDPAMPKMLAMKYGLPEDVIFDESSLEDTDE